MPIRCVYMRERSSSLLVCVCVCERERERERERNLKTKGALLESHCMYSYGSGTQVNLRHMCERHYYTLRH